MKYKTCVAHFVFSKAGHALLKCNFPRSNAKDFRGSVWILAPSCDFDPYFAVGKLQQGFRTWNVWLLQGLLQVSLSSVSIYTEIFSTINNFMGSKASQNKAILSVPRGLRFMIGLNTSKFGNHYLSKMILAHRTIRHAHAAPLAGL